jgi:hypothetical protein
MIVNKRTAKAGGLGVGLVYQFAPPLPTAQGFATAVRFLSKNSAAYILSRVVWVVAVIIISQESCLVQALTKKSSLVLRRPYLKACFLKQLMIYYFHIVRYTKIAVKFRPL